MRTRSVDLPRCAEELPAASTASHHLRSLLPHGSRGVSPFRYGASVGLAILFGQGVLVLSAGLAAAVLFTALKRWAAATGYACPRPLLAVLTALLAAPAASSALRLVRLRTATSFDGDVPELFALSLAAGALLAFFFGRAQHDAAAKSERTRFFAPVFALAAAPLIAWLAVAGVPARLEAHRNAIRSAYDEARCADDTAEAQRILDANPWLREELAKP